MILSFLEARTVLDRLRTSGLCFKPSMCQLFRWEVLLLEHVVTKGGVAADPEKTEGVRTWSQPTNVTELRSFLGLASYYRRFVPDCPEVAYDILANKYSKQLLTQFYFWFCSIVQCRGCFRFGRFYKSDDVF